MTAVPAKAGAGVELICDGCGSVAVASGHGLHDDDVVYVAVAEVGWTGSAFARGPHRCRPCEQALLSVPRHARGPASDDAGVGRVVWHVAAPASLVQVSGDVDIDVVDELRVALEAAVAARAHVVVDLAGAGTIDSVGLGTLVRARQAARQRDGNLVLAAPSRFVLTVLRTMRLHTAFPAYETVPEALAAASAGGPSVVPPPHPAGL
jgi:anti-anti-sigma factor